MTEIETDKIAKGLSEDVVRLISGKKDEPDTEVCFLQSRNLKGEFVFFFS